MSIKPSVVYIRGVHSTTGHDTDSDIGFPQLELEKLFEGATIKETTDTAYDSSKKYIYYDSLSNQVAIQDTGHFNCIKNGYYSIANEINHYYTKSGDNYNYNAVPSNVNTWVGKWSFSNTIKNKDLYSIGLESERVCVGNNYYKKNGNNNYVKQTMGSYDLYDYSSSLNPISLIENNKYISDYDFDDNGNDIIIWTSSNNINISATDGYYLSIDDIKDTNGNKTYNVELCHLTFDTKGVATSGSPKGFLYKLEISSLDTTISNYVKNGSNLVKLELNTPITFATNPANDGALYVYQKLESYSYPNTVAPTSALLYTDSSSSVYKNFNINDFPLYTANVTVTEITKTPHTSYTIYEKTAVKINYNYSGDASSLKFIFTDKDIDGVLEACNLPNDIKKYVHLTNLKYNK